MVTCECCLCKVSAYEPYYEPDYDLCEDCFNQPLYHYDQRHWYATETSLQGSFCNGCCCLLGTQAKVSVCFPNSAKCNDCHAKGAQRDPKWASSMGYPESFTFKTFRRCTWIDRMPPRQVGVFQPLHTTRFCTCSHMLITLYLKAFITCSLSN